MTKLYHTTRLQQLEDIVCKEQNDMFRFAYMRVGVREDAEDLVQEVFLKLFRSEENLKSVRNLRQYLFRSLYNQCLDFYRKKSLQIVGLENAEHIPDIASEDADIHAEYLRIRKLLDGLSPEQQEVVRLKCSDKCRFSDIASILNIPVPTAKSRYRYAIQHIKEQINLKNQHYER